MKLTDLKNISEKREKDFERLGICSQEELINHFPRRYLDLSHVTPLREAYEGDSVLVLGAVTDVESNSFSKRPYVKATCAGAGEVFSAIWFNQPYVRLQLKIGEEYLFYGRVRRDRFGSSLANPSFDRLENKDKFTGIVPVYPLAGNLGQKVVRGAIGQALENVKIESAIPEKTARREGLMGLAEAYRKVHFPKSLSEADEGKERIAVEELFVLVSSFKITKGEGKDRVRPYSFTEEDMEGFVSSFPFKFTDGQIAAVKEIVDDLKGPKVMNRLIQGDVGCGKTAVAACAIYAAVKSGRQAAMLSPTETLARQTAEVMASFLPGVNVAYLGGSLSAEQKRDAKRHIKAGDADVVCGTHALIQKDVEFKDLGLVVCDEQQRFGVAQRAALSSKGDCCDVLVMSATPIPRTLSLIVYGDLDVTTIKDKPAGRQEIKTSIVPRRKYGDMLRYIYEKSLEGEQTYFVCPKIEGDDEGVVAAAKEVFESVRRAVPELKVALLHGKMKENQKNAVMEDFKAKRCMCLVSTTVIEVGIDVPDATTMVICNAERFGLAQLHQLRGRVGRGSRQSRCFLLVGSETEDARKRLTAFKGNSDGFDIAEEDLKIRGGGDFLGTRQSGGAALVSKNLGYSASAILDAKRIADETFESGEDLAALEKIAKKKYASLSGVVLN